MRISPAHNVQDVLEKDPQATRETYETLVDAIAPLGLAYLSILADPAGELAPAWRVDETGHVWWKIRTHANHYELIRSCFIRACR